MFGIFKVKVLNFFVIEKIRVCLELNFSGDVLYDLKIFVGDSEFKFDKIKVGGFYFDLKISFELISGVFVVVFDEYFLIFNDVILCMEIDKF